MCRRRIVDRWRSITSLFRRGIERSFDFLHGQLCEPFASFRQAQREPESRQLSFFPARLVWIPATNSPGMRKPVERTQATCSMTLTLNGVSEVEMDKKWVLFNAILIALVGFPSVPVGIQAADGLPGIEVVFEGNQVFTSDQLRYAMSPSGMAPEAAKPNTRDELEQGLRWLRQFLIGEGYLTPRIEKPQAGESPTGLIFRVHLEEGPVYRLGEVNVTGATVFSNAQIVEVLNLRPGDIFRGETISIWFERVKEMYSNAGYLDFTPIPRQELKEPDSASPEGTVNLTIDLDEGVRVSKSEQRTPPELRPSSLEAFAARPTARVIWSQSVGQLESRDARATITALVVEDPTGSPRLVRGLRIDLAHGEASPGCDWKYSAWRIMCERPNAAVYIEEAQILKVSKDLERGAAEFISRYEKSVNSGAGIVPLEHGLIVCGYQFSDREPKDLLALFTKGIAELKAAP